MGVVCHPKREIFFFFKEGDTNAREVPTPKDLLARPWEGGSKLLGSCTVPSGTVPTEARVRQWPSTQLPLLMVPEMLARLWLLFICQQAGASQPVTFQQWQTKPLGISN